jgi:hypothetical protein
MERRITFHGVFAAALVTYSIVFRSPFLNLCVYFPEIILKNSLALFNG